MARFFLLAFLLCLAGVVPEVSALAEDGGGCPQGYKKVGEKTEETADAIIIHPVCRRIRTQADIYAEKFCKAKSYVDKDIHSVEGLGFETDAAQFEKYEELSKEQRNVFIFKAVMAQVDQALEAGKMAAEAAKPLNPWSVNNAIKDLQKRGFDNQSLFSAMRRIAAVKDKPARAAAYVEFIHQAKVFRAGAVAGYEAAKEPRLAALQLLLGALKAIEVSPEAELAVTSAEFLESAGWYYSLNRAVNEQTEVTERKLIELGKIQQSLKANFAKLKNARTQWQKASGMPGEPACGK